MHEVFISYSKADLKAAENVYDYLGACGIRCWMADRNIPAGMDWAGAIFNAIEGSKAFVLIFSEAANTSGQVANELSLASDRRLHMLLYRIADIKPTGACGYHFSRRQWIDSLDSHHVSGLSKLAKALAYLRADGTERYNSRKGNLTDGGTFSLKKIGSSWVKSLTSFYRSVSFGEKSRQKRSVPESLSRPKVRRKSEIPVWVIAIVPVAAFIIVVLAFLLVSAMGCSSVSSATATIAGQGYVDLGLSVKWETCNVGASSPEGCGNYYAWGETSTKSSYAKYNSKTYGKDMGDIGGNASYDAARANWGSTWRLPTVDEIDELRNNCNWKWTTMNGKNGYKVTSKVNGKSIFLPAAGYRLDSSLYYAGSNGNYWSSTPNTSNTHFADGLYFGSGDVSRYSGYDRYRGRSVRPVSE